MRSTQPGLVRRLVITAGPQVLAASILSSELRAVELKIAVPDR
jgi:hypothetical protein